MNLSEEDKKSEASVPSPDVTPKRPEALMSDALAKGSEETAKAEEAPKPAEPAKSEDAPTVVGEAPQPAEPAKSEEAPTTVGEAPQPKLEEVLKAEEPPKSDDSTKNAAVLRVDDTLKRPDLLVPRIETRKLEPSGKPSVPTLERPLPTEPVRQGLLRLELVDTRQALLIPIKDNILLGRPDPVTGLQPDIDLTPMAGYRMGVSRRHAEIHWYHDNILKIYDLGSSNGTFLNGERLVMNTAYPLYNGDEIRLGQLALYVYYEIQAGGNVIPIRSDEG